MIVTIGTRGQLTIPKELRDALKLGPGDKVSLFERDGSLVLEPVTLTLFDLVGTVQPPAQPVSVAEMHERSQAYVARQVVGDSADEGTG